MIRKKLHLMTAGEARCRTELDGPAAWVLSIETLEEVMTNFEPVPIWLRREPMGAKQDASRLMMAFGWVMNLERRDRELWGLVELSASEQRWRLIRDTLRVVAPSINFDSSHANPKHRERYGSQLVDVLLCSEGMSVCGRTATAEDVPAEQAQSVEYPPRRCDDVRFAAIDRAVDMMLDASPQTAPQTALNVRMALDAIWSEIVSLRGRR